MMRLTTTVLVLSLSASAFAQEPPSGSCTVRTMGERFRAIPVDAGVLDLSRREDIAEVERRLAHVEARP